MQFSNDLASSRSTICRSAAQAGRARCCGPKPRLWAPVAARATWQAPQPSAQPCRPPVQARACAASRASRQRELPACCRPAAAGLACLPPGHACTCGTPSQLLHPRIPWVSWPKKSAACRGAPATHWPCPASPRYRSTWRAAPAVLPLHCPCGASVFDPEAAALAGCRTGCTGRLPHRAQPQLVRSRRGAAHRWAAGPPPEPAAAAQAPAQ